MSEDVECCDRGFNLSTEGLYLSPTRITVGIGRSALYKSIYTTSVEAPSNVKISIFIHGTLSYFDPSITYVTSLRRVSFSFFFFKFHRESFPLNFLSLSHPNAAQRSAKIRDDRVSASESLGRRV